MRAKEGGNVRQCSPARGRPGCWRAVLRAHPYGAAAPNAAGLLPLHLAARAAGHEWTASTRAQQIREPPAGRRWVCCSERCHALVAEPRQQGLMQRQQRRLLIGTLVAHHAAVHGEEV